MRTDNVTSIATKVLVAGVLIFTFGLLGLLVKSDPSKVVCDGQQMSHGDSCISTSSTMSGTYEERVERNIESAERSKVWRPVIMVIGGLLAAGGGIALASRRGRAGQARSERPADSGWWIGQDRN